MGREQITPVGPAGCFEHDTDYRESDPTISVWLRVPPGTSALSPLEVHEIPEQEVVMARLQGPYSLISEAHTRIDEFVRAEGLTLASRHDLDDSIEVLGFNRYLNDCTDTAEEELLTEVCVPLA